MNRKLFFVAIALLAGTLVSCERENISVFNNNGKVGITVSGTESLATKSGSSAEFLGSTVLENIDGEDFRLEMYVEDNVLAPYAQDIQTKGSIVYSNPPGHSSNGINEGLNINGQTFAFNGWLGDENRSEADDANIHFINTTASNGGSWSLNATDSWRNAVPTTFWSWYPVTDAARSITMPDVAQSSLSFTYTTPADVAAQNDLLFAYNVQTVTYDINNNLTSGEGSEYVDINFYHALAAIRFDIAGAIEDGVTIKSIFFEGLATSGTCAVSGTPASNAPGTVAFAWTPGTTTGKISQDVASTDFTATGLDGETANALMPLSSSKFF
ncbi:MAG: fimbrillin family protein, partial [Bacteroidia bacterium]|nr:fimbrillin family protein [Bacteroidia bacterium]